MLEGDSSFIRQHRLRVAATAEQGRRIHSE
jgi:hypothetical protein